MWAEELKHFNPELQQQNRELEKAEHLLHMHTDSIAQMQGITFEVLQRGQELCQVIKVFYLSSSTLENLLDVL